MSAPWVCVDRPPPAGSPPLSHVDSVPAVHKSEPGETAFVGIEVKQLCVGMFVYIPYGTAELAEPLVNAWPRDVLRPCDEYACH